MLWDVIHLWHEDLNIMHRIASESCIHMIEILSNHFRASNINRYFIKIHLL